MVCGYHCSVYKRLQRMFKDIMLITTYLSPYIGYQQGFVRQIVIKSSNHHRGLQSSERKTHHLRKFPILGYDIKRREKKYKRLFHCVIYVNHLEFLVGNLVYKIWNKMLERRGGFKGMCFVLFAQKGLK